VEGFIQKLDNNAKSSTLISIIQSRVRPDSIVCSDCWRGYNYWYIGI